MTDDHPGWTPEVEKRVWERIEAATRSADETPVSELPPPLPSSSRPVEPSPAAARGDLPLPAERHRPEGHRWLGAAAVLVLVAALAGGVYWLSRDRQEGFDVATEEPRPLTVEDLAERAGNMPYTEPVHPRYLRITETLHDVVSVSEGWLDADGTGCVRYGSEEGPDPSTTTCGDGMVTVEGLTLVHLEQIASHPDPGTKLIHTLEALTPTATDAERSAHLTHILAWPGIAPTVRQAAFERLALLGYRVVAEGDEMVVTGPGQIRAFEVDKDSLMVVSAKSDDGGRLAYEASTEELPDS